jgi:hypothetical protein
MRNHQNLSTTEAERAAQPEITHCALCGCKNEVDKPQPGRWRVMEGSVCIRSIKALPLCYSCNAGLCGGKYSAVLVQIETKRFQGGYTLDLQQKLPTLRHVMGKHEAAAEQKAAEFAKWQAIEARRAAAIASTQAAKAEPQKVTLAGSLKNVCEGEITHWQNRKPQRSKIDDSAPARDDWRDTGRRVLCAAYV